MKNWKLKTLTRLTKKILKRLTNFSSSWVKTLTYDNGKEFAKHHEVADSLNVKTYFTRPYTSQDKGTVENRIGVIRRFFPKKTDLRNISNQRVKEVERLLNYRPIRKFNYKNPIEQLKKQVCCTYGLTQLILNFKEYVIEIPHFFIKYIPWLCLIILIFQSDISNCLTGSKISSIKVEVLKASSFLFEFTCF